MTSNYQHVTDFESLPGHLVAGTWEFPEITIEGKRTSKWQVVVSALTPNGSRANIFPCLKNAPGPEHGRIDVRSYVVKANGANGKVREAVPTVVTTGKNIGKATETNAVCQAMRDAYGLYLKRANASEATALPMLAQVYSGQELPWPVHVQYKYDGVRVTACGDILRSRTGLPYPKLEVIKAECKAILAQLPPGTCLDGELYCHGASLQDISGAARGGKTTVALKYYIYDLFLMDAVPASALVDTAVSMPYSKRRELLESCKVGEHCVIAPTFVAANKEALDKLYAAALVDKYEGVMIRLDVPYEHGNNGYHSPALLKYKPCFDAEFALVGFSTGKKGKAAAALMLICVVRTKTGENKEFSITPAMELEDRIALARRMGAIEANGKTHFDNQYAGRPLIVHYDDISNDGVPLRARTKMEFKDSVL